MLNPLACAGGFDAVAKIKRGDDWWNREAVPAGRGGVFHADIIDALRRACERRGWGFRPAAAHLNRTRRDMYASFEVTGTGFGRPWLRPYFGLSNINSGRYGAGWFCGAWCDGPGARPFPLGYKRWTMSPRKYQGVNWPERSVRDTAGRAVEAWARHAFNLPAVGQSLMDQQITAERALLLCWRGYGKYDDGRRPHGRVPWDTVDLIMCKYLQLSERHGHTAWVLAAAVGESLAWKTPVTQMNSLVMYAHILLRRHW